jgi:hypothetical protein
LTHHRRRNGICGDRKTYALVGFPASEDAPKTIQQHDVIDSLQIASLEPIIDDPDATKAGKP